PHVRLLYRDLDVLSAQRREIVMASLSTVTGVFEKIVRTGIDKGVFADVEPKLVALDALFLCHLWSLHARALRGIVADIDKFSEMKVRILLGGLPARKENTSRKTKRSTRAATVNAVG